MLQQLCKQQQLCEQALFEQLATNNLRADFVIAIAHNWQMQLYRSSSNSNQRQLDGDPPPNIEHDKMTVHRRRAAWRL